MKRRKPRSEVPGLLLRGANEVLGHLENAIAVSIAFQAPPDPDRFFCELQNYDRPEVGEKGGVSPVTR